MEKNKKTLPLSGKTVLVTRPKSQNREMVSALKKLGATAVEFPTIEIKPPLSWKGLDQAVRSLEDFDWIILTSVHGAEALVDRLNRADKAPRHLAQLQIACVGPKTAVPLMKWGRTPDLIPETYTNEALIEKLKQTECLYRKRILLPRTDIAPEFLEKELKALGARITPVTAYRTCRPARKLLERARHLLSGPTKADFITFTSASTVRNFFDSLPSAQKNQIKSKLVTIGPVTSAELRSRGLRPFREAKAHTISGLVKAVAGK